MAADPRIDAILKIMRNGRERTTEELCDRVFDITGKRLSERQMSNLLRWHVPGAKNTGNKVFHDDERRSVGVGFWKLVRADA